MNVKEKVIDCYLQFKKCENARTKYERVAYTEPVYEFLNEPVIYFCQTPEHIKARQKRKAEFCISNKAGYLSGVFIPDYSKPTLAFGDMKGTNDLILIKISGESGELEFFILKGKKNYGIMYSNMLADGELDYDIEELKNKVTGGGQLLSLLNQ